MCSIKNYYLLDYLDDVVPDYSQPPNGRLVGVTGPMKCHRSGGWYTCETGDWIPVGNESKANATGNQSQRNATTTGNLTGPATTTTNEVC
jgi:hypothetical protein